MSNSDEALNQKGVPPHNENAERACLGAMLLNPRDTVDRAMHKLRPADFYRPAHGKICEAIVSLYNRGEVVDLITLTEELRGRAELERVGGPAYLASLTDSVPASTNIEYYADIIQQESIRRKLIVMGRTITDSAADHSNKTREILEKFEKQLFEIADNRQEHDYARAGDIVKETIDKIETRYKSDNPFTGIPSGFSDLDNMLSGFQPSDLIIIGARPSIGKTALALSLANRMAMQERLKVGFFTLEMSKISIMMRIISMEARVSAQRIRNGMLRGQDFNGIFDAAGRIYDADLWFCDVPNMPLLDLRAQARRMKRQQDVQIIFIDYLTLIKPEKTEIPRHEQIAEISRSLKALARELDIPIVALSQVGRDSEGKRPTLANIRESGSIEQDADVVLFLHRERGDADSGADGETLPVLKTELIVAKQRNGPTGTVDLAFIRQYAKFEEWSNADYG